MLAVLILLALILDAGATRTSSIRRRRRSAEGCWRGSMDFILLQHQTVQVPQSLVGVATAVSAQQQHRMADHRGSVQRLLRQKRGGARDLPASWFAAFSHDESTYDVDLVDRVLRNHPQVDDAGWHPKHHSDPLSHDRPVGLPPAWFEESDSAGPFAAWRTRFPALESVYSHGLKFKPLVPDHNHLAHLAPTEGSLARSISKTARKPPDWFEDSVLYRDTFGRLMPPSPESPRYYWDWTERSQSVLLRCKKPGCMANASLKLPLDDSMERHAKCRLSIGVHPTDYDDEYSREFVEWIQVNGHTISTFCDPMAKYCDEDWKGEPPPLYPCVMDLPLHGDLLGPNGALELAGQISPMVDECPVDGHMFSAIATMTCFVKPIVTTTTLTPVLPVKLNCTNEKVRLQCGEPGCIDSAVLHPCRPILPGETCVLTVKIWQTDFDNDHGSVEQVDWVKVGDVESGTVVAEDKNPGKNPCGCCHPDARDEEPFTLVDGEDVTEMVLQNKSVPVSAKISQMVDECGRDGNLLDAEAALECS